MIQKKEISEILSNNSAEFIENLARQAQHLTQKHFGKCISLYAPLYLSNYCENFCTYCGFNQNMDIKRTRLLADEIILEMQYISSKGIKNILLLTGESQTHSPLSYIIDAVRMAKRYFSGIGVEIYPLDIEEYQQIIDAGVNSVTIYQETYDQKMYSYYHPKGKKRDYDYRYNTPKRAALAGIRMLSLGVLFGLYDHSSELFNLYSHLDDMLKNFPGIEYSLSVPRIIPLQESGDDYYILSDLNFAKIICLTRILFPYIGINISTRENARIRDQVVKLGVTRMSAESKTTVGGYFKKTEKNGQFHIKDNRPVEEIVTMLKSQGFDPVFTDWRHHQHLKTTSFE